MYRCACILGFGLLTLIAGSSVAAADPAIAVTATQRDASGVYVIASGQGFPAGQPVMAFLVVQNQAYPLTYRDLTTAVTAQQPAPMTDAIGGFQSLAFTLPLPGQVTGTTGEILVSAGPATARAPIGLDSGITTKAGRGDNIAVGIGAGFSVVAIIVIFLLVRGLPIYPVGATTTRRVREPDAT